MVISVRSSLVRRMLVRPPDLLVALQFGSPALPIGGFAYSQGLEWAIENRIVSDLATVRAWILDSFQLNFARQELIFWSLVYQAVENRNPGKVGKLNERIYALKETAELRQESTQMGESLAKLHSIWDPSRWLGGLTLSRPWTYTAAHSALCAVVSLPVTAGMLVFAWSWLENQVLTAVKHLPLGQTQAQALLQDMHPQLVNATEAAQARTARNFGSATTGFAIASSQHETQYSRIFRS